jgi:Na+:H+ antiporter, NhaC family
MADPTGSSPSLPVSLIPVVVLVGLLAASVALFGDGSSGGANQIALMLASGVGMVIGVAHGHPWRTSNEASCTASAWQWAPSSSC